ncbi:hypothetical protein KKG41_04405 [Patescibacteria group bacterium]|nr:hypothetical protein [Patescibacteria group bacterium]MBU1889920.1 hypothetical protein [Patescibacteria group bacterium]
MKRSIILGIVALLLLLTPILVCAEAGTSKAPKNVGVRGLFGVSEDQFGDDAIMIVGQGHFLLLLPHIRIGPISLQHIEVGPYLATGSRADQTEGQIGVYGYYRVIRRLGIYGGMGGELSSGFKGEIDRGIQCGLVQIINELTPGFIPSIPFPPADLQLGVRGNTLYAALVGGAATSDRYYEDDD